MPSKKVKNLKIQEIIDKSKEIDPKKVSSEILTWLANNVENFIDNQKREFKIDLILESEAMSESTKLQELYRSIPEEDDETISMTEIGNISDIKANRFTEVNKCRKSLDKVTKQCFTEMNKNEEMLQALFKRMIFFYELVGISKGTLLVKRLEGAVTIRQFDYEAFSVDVRIVQKKEVENQNGELVTEEVGEAKTYEIPEGFAVWLEIAYKDTIQRPTLF